MLDHIGIAVSDYTRSKQFFAQALSPLGVEEFMDITAEQTGGDPCCGFGFDGKPGFWVSPGPVTRVHIAFAAPSRDAVDAFYKAALAAGGSDNGAPGIRPHYHPNYYAAFVIDPNGHNIEAVCHVPA